MARFAQGLAGSIGVVIAQAAGRDIYSNGALIRFYGRLTVMGGFAAVVGPLIGGVLTTLTDWRGLFVFLAAMGAGILIATLLVFRETLRVEQRIRGGFRRTMSDFRLLISDRVFLGAVLCLGFMYSALFAYISGSSFVLQDIYGLSPLGYALAFGVNSAGFMASGYLAGQRGREVERSRHPCARHHRRLRGCAWDAGCRRRCYAALGCPHVVVPHRQRSGDHLTPCHHTRARRVPTDRRHRFVSARHGSVRLRRSRSATGGRRGSAQRSSARRRHDCLGVTRRGGLHSACAPADRGSR